MICRKFILIVFFTVFSILEVSGKSDPDGQGIQPWGFGTRINYGTIFRFSETQPMLGYTNLQALELYVNKQTFGNDTWSEYYNYPEIELGFNAYRFNMYKEFGCMFSLGPSIKYYLLKKERSSLIFSAGLAVNYATTVYDREENPINRAIGAHWNLEIRGALIYRYALSQNWLLTSSLAYRHMSNGAYQKPNQGQNLMMLGLGAIYIPPKKEVGFQKSDPKYYTERIRVHMMFNHGWKHIHSWMDTVDHVSMLTLSASKRVSMVNSVVVGFDGIYDNSTYHEDWWITGEKGEKSDYDNRRAGLFGGLIFHFGNLSAEFDFGAYIYLPHYLHSRVYQKYGFSYHFYDHVFLHGALVAHRGKADHVQFGIGITI